MFENLYNTVMGFFGANNKQHDSQQKQTLMSSSGKNYGAVVNRQEGQSAERQSYSYEPIPDGANELVEMDTRENNSEWLLFEKYSRQVVNKYNALFNGRNPETGKFWNHDQRRCRKCNLEEAFKKGFSDLHNEINSKPSQESLNLFVKRVKQTIEKDPLIRAEPHRKNYFILQTNYAAKKYADENFQVPKSYHGPQT